ncbi:cardiolipin synthase [Alloyangia pacifica]|uniref:Cardiolipin synthase n=1 Tax=Alloyangia pacifica TaxID=311180 RepID=A0A1I6TRF7_9RHOB|nr:cardiolipin synthase [Alloyangia pacifica]SDH09097.1 cardiolipin synthase [Alloyangia pacifica]SFS91843.1 cardiolipin synthase [Alloyangia pacifica]
MGPNTTTIFAVILAVALPLTVAFAVWRAITTARTPQGAAGWTVFLLAAPWFALPAYLFFGQHKLRGYRITRRSSRAVRREMDAFCADYPPAEADPTRYRAFERLAAMPAVGGNSADLLVDGRATFDAVFEAMDRAQHYLLVQFYTIAEDGLGNEMAARMIAASERGVQVRLIFDGVGSYGLPAQYLKALRDAGVQVVDPANAPGPTSRFQINFRNHRKTVIIDGEEGYIGGHNVKDDYLGKNPTFGPWRDTHLRLRGPMVAQLQLVFAEDWHWATGETIGRGLNWRPESAEENLSGLVLPSGPADDMDTGALFFISAMAEARDRVWIASPYFVPDQDVLSALVGAALRGCDVKVLVPDAIDHYLPWLAAHAFFDEVRAAGVEVLRYEGGFVHQKVILVDDDLAAVGSANLDNRSFRLNFETMAVIFDRGFASRVSKMLEADFTSAYKMDKPLSAHPLWVRTAAPFARLLAPIL